RDEFVRQVADIIDRTFPVCKEALQLARLDNAGIDDIILVGGTTKIPYVRDQVSKFFERAPRTDVSPEDAVALGAGLQATALERILTRKTPSRVAARPAEEGAFLDFDTLSGTTSEERTADTAVDRKRPTAGYSEQARPIDRPRH